MTYIRRNIYIASPLGFSEIGRAPNRNNSKTVRYLLRPL